MRQRLLINTILIISVIMVAGSAPTKKKPARWTILQQWRRNIALGVSSKTVLKALGEPAYIYRRGNAAIWHYQEIPYSVKISKSELESNGRKKIHTKVAKYPKNGSITFSVDKVSKWEEPDWDKLKDVFVAENKRKKPLRPTKKTPKWKIKRSWQRLKYSAHTSEVVKLLGEPSLLLNKYESRRTQKGATYVSWYYGNVEGHGIVAFDKNGRLAYIAEPFWMDVEKEVKKQVEVEKKQAEFDKQKENSKNTSAEVKTKK